MKASDGKGTIQVLFKDLPKIAAHYMGQLDEDNSFMKSLGGPVYRIMRATEFEDIAIQHDHQFDVFREHPADSDYYETVVINNNSGGPTWVVPKQFVGTITKALINENLGIASSDVQGDI